MEKYFDVFLSYHYSDEQRAVDLQKVLETNGIKVWFDDKDIWAGELITPAIEKGIAQSHLVVILVPNGLLKAGWIRKEYKHIVNLSGGEPERLIPVYYKNVKIPKFLADRQGVRLQENSDDERILYKLTVEIKEFVRQRQEGGKYGKRFDQENTKRSSTENTEGISEGKNNMPSDKPSSKESTSAKTGKTRWIAPFLIGLGIVLGCVTMVVLPNVIPTIKTPDLAQWLFIYIPGCLTSIGTITLGFLTFFSDNISSWRNYQLKKSENATGRYMLEQRKIISEIDNARNRLAMDEKRSNAEVEIEEKRIELEEKRIDLERIKLEFEKEKYKNELESKNKSRYFNPE